MKSKSKTRWGLIVLILVALLFLALIIMIGYQYMAMRVMANTPTPLVLIHNPLNQETLYDGEATTIHASARSENGISRMELWVNGEFVTAVDSPGGEPISPLVLSEIWSPNSVGIYEIIIRAIDGNNIEGVGSLVIKSERTDPAFTGVADSPTDEAAGGEEMAGEEAGEPEGAPADGTDSGDDSAPGAGGDSGPGGGGGSAPDGDGGSEAPEGRGDDPPPSGTPLGDLTIMDIFWGIFSFSDDEEEGVPTDEDGFVLLTLEAMDLRTDTGYEELHCYVGLGESTPLWYPDSDLDQSTDESFSSLGSNFWNVQDFLGGDKAILTGWPGSEPIPITINCIATTADGTDAIDLGTAAINAPPEEWDGLSRVAEGEGEGQFWFGYRISMEELEEKGLDPTIPVPYNLRIDERRQELVWEWENTPDGAGNGVTGFMVYVNDTMVFTVDQTGGPTYAARLPASWFTPPCRTEYEFTVAAFKYPYPEGDYSDPSDPVVLPDPDDPMPSDCQPEFRIDFHTLRIGDVSVDGSIFGSIYADSTNRIFQGFPLSSNSSFDVRTMVWESSGERSHFNLEPTPGEVILVGFDLARNRGWDGFDTICESYYDEYDYYELMEYGYFEATLYSVRTDDRGRSLCQMDYTINHVGGTPLGGSSGGIPLPWLDVTGILLEPGTNNILLEITNNGSAMWANLDLTLELESQVSIASSRHRESEFVLDVGETKVIRTMVPAATLQSYCIKIDPDGEVLELYEQTGALDHTVMQYCMPKPDLRLHDVEYDFNTNTLRMRIWNVGSYSNSMGTSAFNTADLSVKIDVSGSRDDFVSEEGQFAGQIIEREEGIWIEWPMTDPQRELMNNGYTVILDPDNSILETDEDNNDFSVPGGETIRVVWNGIYMRWYPDLLVHSCPGYGRWAANDYEVWIDVSVQSDYRTQHIQSWHYEGETHGDTHKFIPRYGWDADRYTVDFYVHGEEQIAIRVSGEQARENLGSATGIYPPEFNWYSMDRIHETARCVYHDDLNGGHSIQIHPTYRSWGRNCGDWYVYVNTCEIWVP